MREIKFQGRGGQGVVMASQMLGLAFFKAGLYPQCYSLFGGERRGAPVVSFLRVDNEKILLKCEIKNPDELLCFDESLLNTDEIQATLRPGGKILINTANPPAKFGTLSDFTIGFVNGPAIAKGVGLGSVINTAMLGAYWRLGSGLSMEYLEQAIDEMVPAKKALNLEAARHGYSKLILGGH
jgi:2-oxoacid:acceptor oxidoreductase gamma subunit (pyruvate/2-ketoisovalerate family)